MQTLFVDGIDDSPQLFRNAQGTAGTDFGFVWKLRSAFDGIERDRPDGILVQDHFVETHAETRSCIRPLDRDVMIVSVFQSQDEDVVQDFASPIQHLGGFVVDRHRDVDRGGLFSRNQHAIRWRYAHPRLAQEILVEFGNKSELGAHFSRVGNPNRQRDGLLVSHRPEIQFLRVQSDHRGRLVSVLIQQTQQFRVDGLAPFLPHVLDGEAQGRVHRLVIGTIGRLAAVIGELLDVSGIALVVHPQNPIAPGGGT
mmetsp:Transcript_32938/g.77785  ORF Transcript_32938/g.77785 Transcript_32938/m.77785 type:complete len:254 (+) Transcript_32938:572-1333(+)